ncbi:hypothetical protein H4R99_007336 [Coemansia sp. RSA 1722]|nr:hypothetical protein LPJ57_004003 [Coemansia sp. RSA 486]KAJ2224584.1 hypothetical protein IWW45_008053 [Coemansia sp. RSA 485]KAJ2589800.1 hypothetical protein H4R99_007336 [Coemansia sp. RSA 1722]KAJ2601767.1 hypothetical protein GGF39_001068 [Coemansia sp. RSA 1721]KAJ2639056.1 hypothetical protein GGF40_001162 [Coemansia sp. RSA 1286]
MAHSRMLSTTDSSGFAVGSLPEGPFEYEAVANALEYAPNLTALVPEPELEKAHNAAQNAVSSTETAHPEVPHSELSQAQPASSPRILNRKSLIIKTAPRVPSTLRKVVDATSPESSDNIGVSLGQRPATALAANGANNANNASMPMWMLSSNSPPLPSLSSRVSSPVLRSDYSEPTLTNLIDRSSTTKCLPYPHTLDSYIPRQRPQSVNTVNSVSCRLSIITVDQEYTEYSYKKKKYVVVRPSKFRGWMRRFGGKVKFTVGQIVASPTLILQGNRDMTRGTAQMSLSEIKKKSRPQSMASANNSLGNRLTRTNTASEASGSSPQSSQRGQKASAVSTIKALSPQQRIKQPTRSLSVIEMAAAAERAAELELAEVTASLFSKRLSTRSSVQSMPHQRSSSGSDTTDVDAEYPAAALSGARTESPLTGPTRNASAENIAKASPMQPVLELVAVTDQPKPVDISAITETSSTHAVNRPISSLAVPVQP